jgi:hypothetical protein
VAQVHRIAEVYQQGVRLPDPWDPALVADAGQCGELEDASSARVEAVQHHSRDVSTSTSRPGRHGSKPCSTSQRTASRHRNDDQARTTSRSTSVP